MGFPYLDMTFPYLDMMFPYLDMPNSAFCTVQDN